MGEARRVKRVVARSVGLALGLVAALGGHALAHDPFEVTTDAHISGGELRLHTTLSLLSAGRICLPPERASRRLVAAEFEAMRPALETCARGFFQVAQAGAPLAPRAVRLALTVEEDLDMNVIYARPTRSPLAFDAIYLRRLTHPSAGVVLTVTGERAFLGQEVLRPDAPTFAVSLEPDAAGLAAPPAPAPSFKQFLALGVQHILGGYDHLLFLLGLLIACRTLRAVLTVVTCFTVAHSVTLALAGLDLVSLPGRIVEPVIAASIVFIGVENLRQRARDAPRGRYALTFLFGLAHGFGFASALREIGLGAPGAPIVLPLLGFNLGVELGQIAIATIALPVLWTLRRRPLFARYGPGAISIAISVAGLIWLVQRIA
jgi:hydrogenase/urease accessory protein HupE